MDPEQLRAALTSAFADVDVLEAGGTTFFYAHKYQGRPQDQRFCFATLVTDDDHYAWSQLSRPGVYRLNIGLERETYRERFGPPPAFNAPASGLGYDFSVLDQLLPHPVYAAMSWVCVLNPSPETFEQLRPLLEAAYRRAARQAP